MSVQVLLLSPSCIEAPNQPATITRLTLFCSASNSNPAIALLLSDESFQRASGKSRLDALLALQVLLVESLDLNTTTVPVIPVPDASRFFACMQEYLAHLVDLSEPATTGAESLSLLTRTTAAYPRRLSDQERDRLSDLFPSLRALSEAVCTEQGKRILVENFGETRAEEMITFWGREVVIN